MVKVYIRCKTCKSPTDPLALYKLNSFDKTEFLENTIGVFTKAFKSLASGPLLVECDTLEQVQKLLASKTFKTIPISVEINHSVGTVKGVVVDPSICDLPVERVLNK